MRLGDIRPEHLGAGATEGDVAIYEEAVRRIAAERFNGDEDAADDYLWGGGDYMRRLPKDLLAKV